MEKIAIIKDVCPKEPLSSVKHSTSTLMPLLCIQQESTASDSNKIQDRIKKLQNSLVKEKAQQKGESSLNKVPIEQKFIKLSDIGHFPKSNCTRYTLKNGQIFTLPSVDLKVSNENQGSNEKQETVWPQKHVEKVIMTMESIRGSRTNLEVISKLPKTTEAVIIPGMTSVKQTISPNSLHGLIFPSKDSLFKLVEKSEKETKVLSPGSLLKDSKTNASTNPPPLHPISKMSLINLPKSNNSLDSIKISENPDSAVITPIPKADDSSLPEKRKKISNILRTPGEKRIKRSLSQPGQDANNLDSFTTYYHSDEYSNSQESEQEKDKRKDSDDEITLIKVVNSDQKKIKPPLVDEEVKIEAIKNSNRSDADQEDESDKINGKLNENNKDYRINQNNINFDANKIIVWNEGVGSLPGSSIKFTMHEYGFMEVVPPEDSKKEKTGNNGDKENVCRVKNQSKTASSINEKKPEERKARVPSTDDFYCCEACGCHGLASEFDSPSSCSTLCTKYLEGLKRSNRKDINKDLKLKKKRKKLLQQEEFTDKDNKKDNLNDYEIVDNSKKEEEKLDKSPDLIYKSSTDEEDTKDTNTSVNDQDCQEEVEPKYPWLNGKNFVWSKYLDYTKSKPAPINRFKDAFPCTKNLFKAGMKLEGIDPNHPSHYCVLTIAEVIGYRLRLHFDGYPENYDFYTNADSLDIFPVGWAEKNGHILQPPKGYVQSNFNWNAYLKICKAAGAPKSAFATKNTALAMTAFRVGMKLEAVDRKHSSQICVASIAGIMDSRILVHFDSWDDVYDYWADITSPYIHPVGWCKQNNIPLTPPNYFKGTKSFNWDDYLQSTNSLATPARAFKPRQSIGFKKGMKLEAVDKRVPQLIRVATVEDVKDYMIKIRFDGWPENLAYWVDDDSPDIHPMGYCQKTSHPLEIPLIPEQFQERSECGTHGCRGIGHVKGPKFATHNTPSGCPYSPQNINKIKTVTDRLSQKFEINDFEDDVISHVKEEKNDRAKSDRNDKYKYSYDERNIKVEKPIKIEDDTLSDKCDISDRLSLKWRNNSDGLTDEEEVVKKRKKRKITHTDLNLSGGFCSAQELSQSYSTNIPEKQLRLELYQSVYTPGYSPMPDAPHIWAKHSNALNRVVAKQNTNPRRWSNEEVIKFIQSVPNCKEFGSIFRKHNFDGEAFLMLTQEDLISILGLKLGPAIKLYNSIVLLRKRAS